MRNGRALGVQDISTRKSETAALWAFFHGASTPEREMAASSRFQ
ncbi:hypothetical protein [Acanthopleuribacter pedis]|nr:hypothetical protein [Acanthopleuribacter pedis]